MKSDLCWLPTAGSLSQVCWTRLGASIPFAPKVPQRSIQMRVPAMSLPSANSRFRRSVPCDFFLQICVRPLRHTPNAIRSAPIPTDTSACPSILHQTNVQLEPTLVRVRLLQSSPPHHHKTGCTAGQRRCPLRARLLAPMLLLALVLLPAFPGCAGQAGNAGKRTRARSMIGSRSRARSGHLRLPAVHPVLW